MPHRYQDCVSDTIYKLGSADHICGSVDEYMPYAMLLVPWFLPLFTKFYDFISQVLWPFIRLCQNVSGEGLGAFVASWQTCFRVNFISINLAEWPHLRSKQDLRKRDDLRGGGCRGFRVLIFTIVFYGWE